jgi:hypothetical protein
MRLLGVRHSHSLNTPSYTAHRNHNTAAPSVPYPTTITIVPPAGFHSALLVTKNGTLLVRLQLHDAAAAGSCHPSTHQLLLPAAGSPSTPLAQWARLAQVTIRQAVQNVVLKPQHAVLPACSCTLAFKTKQLSGAALAASGLPRSANPSCSLITSTAHSHRKATGGAACCWLSPTNSL